MAEGPSTSGRDEAEPRGMQKRLRQLPLFLRDFMAGGLAGGIAKTGVAPLERTKILFQTRGGEMTSVTGTIRFMWQNEGVWGLFKGNGASVLRIVPYAALHFSSFEYYKRLIHKAVERRWPAAANGAGGGSTSSAAPATSHAVWDLIAGSLSGATAVAATYPLDLVRTRLAWATEGQASHSARRHHLTIRDMLRHTVAQEGWQGLYRGVLPTIIGILPYAGLKFFTYQHLKNSYKAWQAAQQGSPANPASPGGQQQPAAVRMPLHLALVFGGISGLVGQTLTYPLDVIRRTMQVEGMRQLQDSFAAPLDRAHASGPARPLQRRQRPSMLQTAQQIGVRGMFRGLSLNYLKVVPSTAVGWTVYELSKAYLGCHSVL